MSEPQTCDSPYCDGQAMHFKETEPGTWAAFEPCPVNNPGYVDPEERARRRRLDRERRSRGVRGARIQAQEEEDVFDTPDPDPDDDDRGTGRPYAGLPVGDR